MKHQVYIDVGRSFEEFWQKGDVIIDKLKQLNNEMEAS
jgi:hypothetical protein